MYYLAGNVNVTCIKIQNDQHSVMLCCSYLKPYMISKKVLNRFHWE